MVYIKYSTFNPRTHALHVHHIRTESLNHSTKIGGGGFVQYKKKLFWDCDVCDVVFVLKNLKLTMASTQLKVTERNKKKPFGNSTQ